MFLTSIILTAAALYLLTYGGRTSIEETVVARDAMTEHYVTPYYKIESVSDDRGVPQAAPDPNPHTVSTIELDSNFQYMLNPMIQRELDPSLLDIERTKLKDRDVAGVQTYVDSIKQDGFGNVQMAAVLGYAKEHDVDTHWGNP